MRHAPLDPPVKVVEQLIILFKHRELDTKDLRTEEVAALKIRSAQQHSQVKLLHLSARQHAHCL